MNSHTPAPEPPQTSKASVPLLPCRAAARQRRRDFPVSVSVSHTHTHTGSSRRLSALSREYFSFFPMPYLQKQESRVPSTPRFCSLPCSSCPPRRMMLRRERLLLGAAWLNAPSPGSR